MCKVAVNELPVSFIIMSSTDDEVESMEETLRRMNECKERNRLRLLNIKRMVKIFGSEIVRNTKVLPNYNAETLKQLKHCCGEVVLAYL